ncbi:cytochrome P450 [Nitratireductor aquimarinus]|uniref:cytochrome P450 n=1 Tax=Alphaproteobacteria TaxID=28211 RepID=UPI0019D3418C|nr:MULTISPECIES: cytochrome P450 [Alphaproteobacteria]MBN7757465.1 cytochrome P450 [Nitratireductor aquimarinus]MBY6000225.1 cytochrome P450 [Tritonibacter mobilis]MBY6022254.1 cytochrome P450 [Nitratireductor sp. DP7N14-4]
MTKTADNAATNGEKLAEGFELTALPAGFVDDPFPVYHALLEHAPLKRFADGSVMLSRYEDLDRVYRDTKTFSSDKKAEFLPKFGDTPLYEHHTTSLVFNDPPLHTRVRKIMMGALTPRALAALEPGLITLVDGLLDRMEEKGEVDLIEDFAAAIPIEVIGNLFDIPHEAREPLRDWSLAILGALEPVLTDEQLKWGNTSVTDFKAFLKDIADDRRRNPGDPATDVLTRLINGNEGEELSEVELLQNCIFILNAGHETTTNLIGNALYELLHWPEEKARLEADPDLIATAVDEFLRFQSPNQLGNRMAVEPVEFHGETVEPGTPIHLCIGAANRDPRQFADPDRLDVGRRPNKHLAFAGGPHLCAGFSLARMEGRIGISHFLKRFPDYRMTGEPERTGRVRFRGFSRLPARVR